MPIAIAINAYRRKIPLFMPIKPKKIKYNERQENNISNKTTNLFFLYAIRANLNMSNKQPIIMPIIIDNKNDKGW